MIVEHIVANRIIEAHIESEVLPTNVSKDITVDVRIGVTNDCLISLRDLTIVVEVLEINITSLEILICTSSILHIEISLRILGCHLTHASSSIGAKHAIGTITVEHTKRLTNDSSNIICAID